MCGIVGAIAQRDVDLILLEGLRRLEYRGYDSAGIAVVDREGELHRTRRVGKVAALSEALADQPLSGPLGLAHTRWATHGPPTELNAHPHFSMPRVALVHNGIIENFQELKERLQDDGVSFESDTDTEVAAHLIRRRLENGSGTLLSAVLDCARELRGAFALAVIDRENPDVLVGARRGSPLVLGIGLGEHFLASDVGALLPVTQRFVYLEEGDVVEATRFGYQVFDETGAPVEREVVSSTLSTEAAEKGKYRHYMQKEIHEQPDAIANTLEGRIADSAILSGAFGPDAAEILPQVRFVHIVACGTSYHAGLIAKYWIESIAGIPCSVEISSEFRYRESVVPDGALFLTISQSGETADTLAALKRAKTQDYLATMTICNVPESSIVRASDLVMMTRAGTEVGVASTKAFTTQLTVLFLITLGLCRERLDPERQRDLVGKLEQLPRLVQDLMAVEPQVIEMSDDFVEKENALFLGRGAEYPVAMEGALKLKEISYIHAEAYAAGELKHGPLALVDEHLPVVVSAPSNELLEKLVSNLQEVRARGGQLYLFADQGVNVPESDIVHMVELPVEANELSPILHTIPLQLLAYHVAVQRGTDVDQPRNLAKSVTVE
ncbi:MAG: glutamine--fructose-6-phosphate transaminase (isomerizing) [Xanthomonadales bacterium]|nr:glutamine--fructose-6-phosphate transaminase (isomerizing) [Xanthomonadales bacterium]